MRPIMMVRGRCTCLPRLFSLGIAAAALIVDPAAAQQRFTLIAASFAISAAHPSIVAMWSTPQSVPVYNTEQDCQIAGEAYALAAQIYMDTAANILGAGTRYEPYVITQCEPTGDSPAPGATLQFDIATGIGNMARGSNGNVISISARLDTPANCAVAKADLAGDFKQYLSLLPNRVSGPFCY
jgi:hypothetical protein